MNTQEKVLHTSSRFWIQEIGGLVLIFVVTPIAGFLYFGRSMYWGLGFFMLVGILLLISEFITARRQEIVFSKSEIKGRIGKEDFKQSWDSIKAVRFTGHGQSRCLVLYCDDHYLNIPCRHFNEAELIDLLHEHLSPGILHPLAYQRHPWFLEWQEYMTIKLSAIKKPLIVSLGGFEKWLGLFGVSLGIFLTGFYLLSKVRRYEALVCGGLFGGLGLLLLLLTIGRMEGDTNQISVRSIFRKNTFVWSDLKEIYLNTNQGVMAFIGDNSRLILPKVSSWSGKDKDLFFELITYKIEMSKIEPKESIKPLFWFSKNS